MQIDDRLVQPRGGLFQPCLDRPYTHHIKERGFPAMHFCRKKIFAMPYELTETVAY